MDPSALIESWSYLGIVVFLILTGCGLPIPEEVPIIAAGVLSRDTLNPWLALAACLVGAVVGDSMMYFIGRRFGRRLLERGGFVSRFFTPEREAEIEEQIRRHGMKVLLAARFLVGVRSPVYLTAGILKVPFRRFFVADAICALFVIPLFFGLAYLFADHIQTLWQWLRRAELAVTLTIAAGALAALLVLRYVRSRRAAAHAAEHESRKTEHPEVRETASAGRP